MAKEEEKKKKIKKPTALKRDIQNEKRREQNKQFKSTVRTAVRNFEEAVSKKEPAKIKETLNGVYSLLDKAVLRGTFKLNKAARTKSRLAARAMNVS